MAEPAPKSGKVLFVDDEPAVLRALQRAMRAAPFEVRVAAGGAEAEQILAQYPADIVVADVRMPGMDGIELLKLVRERYPLAGRLVLSGQVDRSTILSALTSGVARAFFTKPWDDEALQRRLHQLLLARRELASRDLLDVLETADSLPALPRTYVQVRTAVEEGKSLSEVARLIERDVAISGKVLQTVNSAVYGRGGITSVDRAIAMLGVDAVRDITLFMSFVEGIRWKERQRVQLDALVQHGLTVQRCASLLVRGRPAEEVETAGISGLFHDAGQILILRSLPARFEATAKLVEEQPSRSFLDAEVELGLGDSSHARIGAHMLDRWNLPQAIVEAVLWHHAPDSSDAPPARRSLGWADRAATAARAGAGLPPLPPGLVDPSSEERVLKEAAAILERSA